jgi:hypothetical protein
VRTMWTSTRWRRRADHDQGGHLFFANLHRTDARIVPQSCSGAGQSRMSSRLVARGCNPSGQRLIQPLRIQKSPDDHSFISGSLAGGPSARRRSLRTADPLAGETLTPSVAIPAGEMPEGRAPTGCPYRGYTRAACIAVSARLPFPPDLVYHILGIGRRPTSFLPEPPAVHGGGLEWIGGECCRAGAIVYSCPWP